MRIYVLSAYATVRAGLAALVRGQPGWRVVGEASPEIAARRGGVPQAAPPAAPLAPSAADGPDVLLADLEGVAGETVDAWLAALRPLRGIVALGAGPAGNGRGERMDAGARLLAEVLRSAGERGLAYGALRRDASEEEILAAVASVGSGLITLDPALAGVLFAPVERQLVPAAETAEVAGEALTARELEVLQLLAQGLPNKLIAQRLHISEHTAKFHVSAILMKLGAASRTEAVTTAARRGWLIL